MENMLNHNDLRKGTKFIYQSNPYEVLEYNLSFKGRGSSVMQVKIKNLISSNVVSKTFHPSDKFEEAEIKKIHLKFIYSNKEDFVFANKEQKRITLKKDQIGIRSRFLKQNLEVEGMVFNEEIINIELPIKMDIKVKEAPPGIKGGRSEAGTKQVVLESGAIISVPLFISEGDMIEINTETGEYVKRVE